MIDDDLTYRDAEWPHGLACPDCGHVFNEGEQYSQELDGFVEDVPLTHVTCVPCALTTT